MKASARTKLLKAQASLAVVHSNEILVQESAFQMGSLSRQEKTSQKRERQTAGGGGGGGWLSRGVLLRIQHCTVLVGLRRRCQNMADC